MRKILILVGLFAGVVLFFTACKKDDEASTLSKLQGSWNFQKEYFHSNFMGIDTRDTILGDPGEFIEFRNDNKVYSYIDTERDTLGYQLLGENKLIRWEIDDPTQRDTSNIITLTNSQLTLSYYFNEPGFGYYEGTIFLVK